MENLALELQFPARTVRIRGAKGTSRTAALPSDLRTPIYPLRRPARVGQLRQHSNWRQDQNQGLASQSHHAVKTGGATTDLQAITISKRVDMSTDTNSLTQVHSGIPSSGRRSVITPVRLEFRNSFPSSTQTGKAGGALLARALDSSVAPAVWKSKLDDSKARVEFPAAVFESLMRLAADSGLPIEAVVASLVQAQWTIEQDIAHASEQSSAQALAAADIVRIEREEQIAREAELILPTVRKQRLERRNFDKRIYVNFACSSSAHILMGDLPGAKQDRKSREWSVSEKYVRQLDTTLDRVQSVLRREYAERQAELKIEPLPKTVFVRVFLSEDRLVLDFPYSVSAVDIVRNRLKGAPAWALFDGTTKRWSVRWVARKELCAVLPAIEAACR